MGKDLISLIIMVFFSLTIGVAALSVIMSTEQAIVFMLVGFILVLTGPVIKAFVRRRGK